MEVNKKILSIMRIIEAIPGFDRSKKMGYIYNANKLLTDADRAVLTDVMKAMILLTAGNQEAVRDPKSYDPAGARDNYSWLIGSGVGDIIQKLGLDIDLKSKPTREDYLMAHKLLPTLGASTVSPDELLQYTDMGTKDPMSRYGSEGNTKVYRGLSVSLNVIVSATKRKKWNIGRGVSTTSSEKKGMEFAKSAPNMFGANGGPGLLLNIENKSKRGFHAKSMSRYPREHEIILSGILEFGDWVLEARCKDAYEREVQMLLDSQSESAEFFSLRKGERVHQLTQKFPTKKGQTFTEFLDQALSSEGWHLGGLTDGKKPFLVIEESILLRMNAVLE